MEPTKLVDGLYIEICFLTKGWSFSLVKADLFPKLA